MNKIFCLARWVIAIALVVPVASMAETKYQFVPSDEAIQLPHPLYGELPNVERNENFASIKKGSIEVFMRITGGTSGDKATSGVVFMIKNHDSERTINVRPILDFVDGTGQVLTVMDLPKLLEAAKTSNGSGSSGSFFVYGNRKFVNDAMGAYAVGSIISSMIRSSNREKASKMTLLVDGHWLKPEYRIPPQARIDGIAILNGLPQLPLTARITIGSEVFAFHSAETMGHAETNYAKGR
jgi:hypothetical protein